MSNSIFNFSKTLTVIVALAASANIYSQNAEEKVIYTQESQDSSDYNYRRKYQYLDIILKEENKMLSLSLSPSTVLNKNEMSSYYGINVLAAFDKKFIPSLSSYVELGFSYSYIKDSPGIIKKANTFSTGLKIGVKYFYKQQKNIDRKISASNFNGPYIDFKLNNLVGINIYSWTLDDNMQDGTSIELKEILNESSFVWGLFDSYSLSWGYQQKITRFFIMDGSIFIAYQNDNKFFGINNSHLSTKYNFNLGFALKLGLGWGWK